MKPAKKCILSDKLPGKSGSAGRARKLFAANLLVTKGLEYKKEHHLRIWGDALSFNEKVILKIPL